LPVGTVRLMTTLNLPGVIRPVQAEQVRRYVRALLESRLPSRPNLADSIAVALGGNAETLMTVAPGPREHGVPTLQLSLLRERLDDILRRDVRERMKVYAVRRDRGNNLRNARPLSQPAHSLDPRRRHSRRTAPGNRARGFFPQGAASLQCRRSPAPRRHAQLRAPPGIRSTSRRARARAEHPAV
jgi:hypothetical protein